MANQGFWHHVNISSIKKKVKGGTTTGGSKTLPSSNSSPVHSVQPPPHSGAKPQGGARPTNGDTSEPISSAIVKYNYQAQQLDELSLVKGSRVMILEKSGDGWWRGQYGNKVTSVIVVSKDTCLPFIILDWLVSL